MNAVYLGGMVLLGCSPDEVSKMDSLSKAGEEAVKAYVDNKPCA